MTDWLGKPYYSLDAYLKKTFGEKVYKLSLDGGMTCPNRDGTCGDRGCIFCSAGGSGDFAGDRNKSIPEQIREQKFLLQQKRPVHKFIAYFQAYTNTYAPVEYLEKIFREAISDEEVVVLSIGTRPDCLGEEVLSLLEELNRIKPVWVELGLQTTTPLVTKSSSFSSLYNCVYLSSSGISYIHTVSETFLHFVKVLSISVSIVSSSPTATHCTSLFLSHPSGRVKYIFLPDKYFPFSLYVYVSHSLTKL